MSAGWRALQLGDVCQFKYGKSLPKARRSGSGFGVFGSNGQVGLHDEALTDGTTIIVGRKGSLGEVTYSNDRCWPIDTTYYVDRSVTDADLRWLYYRMKAMPLTQLNRAAAVPGLNRDDAYVQKLLLPPIGEQRRLAEVLDAAEVLRAKRSEALAKLNTLTQAVFINMFGDSRQPSAKTVPLADLAEIVMGQSPPGDTYNESGIGVPLLNGPSEFGDKHPVPVQWTTSPTRMSREGDILFCVRGATAGRLNWADADYCLGRGLAAIRAEPSHRAFLFRVLDAHYVRFQSSGVGSTFINIGKSDLHGVPVPMASTSAVLEYARIYSALSEQRTALNVSLAKIDELYLSLQQRAFRGEL